VVVTVRVPDGMPLPGATVAWRDDTSWRDAEAGGTTDAGGQATLTLPVPAGRAIVVICTHPDAAPAHTPVTTTAGTASVDVTLGPGGAIEVRTTRDGVPAATRIGLRHADAGFHPHRMVDGGPDGITRIDRLRPGRYWVWAAGDPNRSPRIDVRAGETTTLSIEMSADKR
jgi:hypothetical protein